MPFPFRPFMLSSSDRMVLETKTNFLLPGTDAERRSAATGSPDLDPYAPVIFTATVDFQRVFVF